MREELFHARMCFCQRTYVKSSAHVRDLVNARIFYD